MAFCGMWWESHRELAVTGGDLFQLAKPNRLLMDVWGGRNELSATQRIGHALEARRDRVYGRFVIRSAKRDSHTGSKAYRLEERTVSDAE